ncbi:molecular chaperone [Clostridia bacterium]|nr:molecular chaperone [Clostridia bacterium]
MAIEVFNRYENKYLIDGDTLRSLIPRISGYMEPDAYNKRLQAYSISNIYYDTWDSHLIRSSLSKPKYKEKLRLRAYGVPDSGSKVYVEIKKKCAGLVNKRRSALRLGEAYRFLEDGRLPAAEAYMNRQVLGEIQYLLQRQSLSPAVCLSYDRLAWFGLGQHDVRVSFDSNVRARRDDILLEHGAYGALLLPEDMYVMEVKVARSIPVWLSKLMAEYRIYPQSFSKYGAEYRRRLSGEAAPDTELYTAQNTLMYA